MLINGVEVDNFTKAYLSCSLFCENDEQGEALEKNYSIHDFSEKTILQARAICNKFKSENSELLQKAYSMKKYQNNEEYSQEECAAHDLWYTQNGRGVGFWDRGFKEVGERLTESCRKYRELHIEIGDDKKLYFI